MNEFENRCRILNSSQNREKRGKIIVVSAPSGTGKTTILKKFLAQNKDYKFSVSYTTRAKRDNETNGVEYFFITEQEFLRKIESGDFLEWEKVYDYYYGTDKNLVELSVSKGDNILIEVDVKGALSIKKLFPEAILVFIEPPSMEELKRRLINRKTENELDLSKRLNRAEMEMKERDKFTYIICNEQVDKTLEELQSLLNNITERNE